MLTFRFVVYEVRTLGKIPSQCQAFYYLNLLYASALA